MPDKSANQEEHIRTAILDTLIVVAEAQLRALRALRNKPHEKPSRKKVGTSQVDLIEDILTQVAEPMHIALLIKRVEQVHGVQLDRESIVSALTKKIRRNERFVRTAKNTFAIKQDKS